MKSVCLIVTQNGKFLKGASINSEFAQMPHKGTPIRYGQNQLVRNRQQGAGKFCRAAYVEYVSKEFFAGIRFADCLLTLLLQRSSWNEIRNFRGALD